MKRRWIKATAIAAATVLAVAQGALRRANRELAERIYRFLSPEVARALREDVESLGQVPWEEIKQAQQQIRNILRGLVTLGKIKFK